MLSPEPALPMAALAPRPAVHRIAVLRALQAGDLLCAVPALRALRAGYPRAHITLIGLPWARSFGARFAAYIDDFAEFPGYEGMPERTAEDADVERFFAWARERSFDLAVQLHGSGAVSNKVLAALGARQNAGFHPAGEPCPDPLRFMPYPESGHEIRRCLKLMAFLGLPRCGERLEFPLSREDFREYAALPEAAGLAAATYVCIHPGSRAATRRWAPERFAAVADALAARGLQVVITGSGAEAALAQQVADAMQAPALHLARDISLGALAVVISRARLLIANDTGVSHVAAALGTPSVIIFTAADPGRWAPLDSRRHRAVSVPVDCRPCTHAVCPIGHPCAQGITAANVIDTAGEVLSLQESVRPCSTS